MVKQRFVGCVVFLCLVSLNFGNYYIWDLPQELAGDFLRYFEKDPSDIEDLYSLFYLPSTVMALASGFLIRGLGASISCMICSFMIVVSSIVSAYGVQVRKFEYINYGRLIYGLFAGVNYVSQSTIISEIYFGKHLSIAAGISLAINNMGLAGSNFLTAKIWLSSRNMLLPFFVAAFTCAFSCFAANIWGILDMTNYKKKLQEAKKEIHLEKKTQSVDPELVKKLT